MALTTLVSITGSAEIGATTRRKNVYAVVLTPAAALATLNVYEGTSNAGTKRLTLQAGANGPSVVAQFEGAVFSGGVFMELAGAGASAAIETVEL